MHLTVFILCQTFLDYLSMSRSDQSRLTGQFKCQLCSIQAGIVPGLHKQFQCRSTQFQACVISSQVCAGCNGHIPRLLKLVQCRSIQFPVKNFHPAQGHLCPRCVGPAPSSLKQVQRRSQWFTPLYVFLYEILGARLSFEPLNLPSYIPILQNNL